MAGNEVLGKKLAIKIWTYLPGARVKCEEGHDGVRKRLKLTEKW